MRALPFSRLIRWASEEAREVISSKARRRCSARTRGGVEAQEAAASDAAKFGTIRAEAQAVHEHAERVLAADYSGIYDRD